MPDFDVGVGIKLAVMDNTEKGKKLHGITINVSSRKNPEESLFTDARYNASYYHVKVH